MNRAAKILIVEDDTPVAMMIAYLLTRAQCEVAFAHTAKKGMEMAEAVQPLEGASSFVRYAGYLYLHALSD